MRLTNLTITNFRSIKGTVSIDVPSQHVALVGSNNSGKSNILMAIDWVLGSRSPYQLRADVEDYFDPAQAIVITAEIGDFLPADNPALMSIASSKQQRGALAKKDDPSIVMSVTIPPLSGQQVEEEGDEEPPNDSVVRPTLELSLWGFGIHQKTADRRSRIVQSVRVASERKIADDLQASRWTPYGLLMKAILEASPLYEELAELLAEVNSKIQEVFASEKATLIGDARVVSYVEDIAFQLTRENKPTELLRYLEILVTEDGKQTNLSRSGSGTQSAVIIGMLELVLKAKTSEVKIFSVEEPDAFIHPHGVRRLAELIEQIGEDQGSQVILTTHSPALIATLAPSDIVRVEKRDGATVIFQSPGTLADPVFARYVNQDTAEMFFAKRVILVEGATEKFLLPPLSALLSDNGKTLDFDTRKTSVIAMHSKDSVVNYLRILNEFDIETRAILDKDFLGGSSCTSLVSYLRSLGKTIDDSNDTELQKSLWKEDILVLNKGEIEDYIPEADISTVSGQSLVDVQAELAATPKTSNALKKIFRSTKPMYARQLAEHYVQTRSMPTLLEKLIRQVSG